MHMKYEITNITAVQRTGLRFEESNKNGQRMVRIVDPKGEKTTEKGKIKVTVQDLYLLAFNALKLDLDNSAVEGLAFPNVGIGSVNFRAEIEDTIKDNIEILSVNPNDKCDLAKLNVRKGSTVVIIDEEESIIKGERKKADSFLLPSSPVRLENLIIAFAKILASPGWEENGTNVYVESGRHHWRYESLVPLIANAENKLSGSVVLSEIVMPTVDGLSEEPDGDTVTKEGFLESLTDGEYNILEGLNMEAYNEGVKDGKKAAAEEANKARKQIKELLDKLDEAKTTLEKSGEENKKLAAELSKKDDELAQANNQIATLNEEIRDLTAANEQLRDTAPKNTNETSEMFFN